MGVSRALVSKLIQSGELAAVKSGPGRTDPWWIPEAEVERYVAEKARHVLAAAKRACEPAPATPPPVTPVPEPALETTDEPIDGPSMALVGLCARWGKRASEVQAIMARADVVAHRVDGRLRFRVGDVHRVERSEGFEGAKGADA